MTDTTNLAEAFAAGMLLGSLFFGGLWWTTRKAVKDENPALWFLGSLILRTGVMAAGFYFVTDGDWRRALACLSGFMIARLVVLRKAKTLLHRPAAAMEARGES